jgi:very-short-patch-repair endonuclease
MQPYPQQQKLNSRRLRREQTDAESKLWARLRGRQLCNAKFRRQHAIGPFLTDFCAVERGLVIELDGGACNSSPSRSEKVCLSRTEWLSSASLLG